MRTPSRLNLARALRLLMLLALAAGLAGCGHCADWPWTRDQTGACHADPPPQG